MGVDPVKGGARGGGVEGGFGCDMVIEKQRRDRARTVYILQAA
jgi:hypothetical protein